MLEVQNLHKSYVVGKDTYEVLKGVDFTIKESLSRSWGRREAERQHY